MWNVHSENIRLTTQKQKSHDRMECISDKICIPVLVAHSSLSIPSMNISSFHRPGNMSAAVPKPKRAFLPLLHAFKLEQPERLRSEDTPAASWLPILLSHIRSQVKRRQRQSSKFKELAKLLNVWNTHLLMLLSKMCKYKMGLTSIVEDTVRTRFCPQTDRRTNGQTD